jgi:hypothetical protein
MTCAAGAISVDLAAEAAASIFALGDRLGDEEAFNALDAEMIYLPLSP